MPLVNIDATIDATLAALDTKKKSHTFSGRMHPRANGDLPPALVTMLHATDAGGYPSRSELLFAFLTGALRARVAEEKIIAACLDQRYANGGIYQHVEENGARAYVERQLVKAHELINLRAEQIAQNIKIGDDVSEPIFPEIMTLDQMHERLVFIGDNGAIVDRLTGRVRKKEMATDEYAASLHHYTVGETQKKAPALKFWIASPHRVTVDVLAWVPGAKEICRAPEEDPHKRAFNSWRGITPMPAPVEWEVRVKPFLEHVEFLLPEESERTRFLQWLAHIVQRPEVLPHTSYLMITQITGIGMDVETHSYPTNHRLHPEMLRDVNRWIIRRCT